MVSTRETDQALKRDVGNLTDEPTNAITEFAIVGLVVILLAFILSIFGMFIYMDKGDVEVLSSQLGGSNPISLGALLTGLVAAGGITYAIDRDRGNRFTLEDGSSIQVLISTVALIAVILNVVWEYMRSVTSVHKQHVERFIKEQQSSNATDEAPTLSFVDLVFAWFSPNVLMVAFVSAGALAIFFTLSTASRPDLQRIHNKTQAVSKRLASRENATAFLQLLNTELGDFRPALSRASHWKSRSLLIGLIVAGTICVFQATYTSENSLIATVAFLVLGVLGMSCLAFAFKQHRRQVLSFGLLVQKSTAYYYLSMLGLVTLGTVAVGFLLAPALGGVLLAVTVSYCVLHFLFIHKVKKFQNKAIRQRKKAEL
ncbi:hypothetical protein [Corynebacterium coyleae]|uniref:hypothetical protein n=1 Tax=Corynebacterium coyleae TaxID=53374 RepID=UPI0025519BFB|nr:hypothetical protein [Corynebacterium coyleae]MDK8800541.1 hypothetical protein [Corynebacterium coyleae]